MSSDYHQPNYSYHRDSGSSAHMGGSAPPRYDDYPPYSSSYGGNYSASDRPPAAEGYGNYETGSYGDYPASSYGTSSGTYGHGSDSHYGGHYSSRGGYRGSTDGPGRVERREGDWDCPSCGNHNFARRMDCRQCRAPRVDSGADSTRGRYSGSGSYYYQGPPSGGSHGPGSSTSYGGSANGYSSYQSRQAPPAYSSGPSRPRRDHDRKPGDWDCPSCGLLNFARRTYCLQCNSPGPAPDYGRYPYGGGGRGPAYRSRSRSRTNSSYVRGGYDDSRGGRSSYGGPSGSYAGGNSYRKKPSAPCDGQCLPNSCSYKVVFFGNIPYDAVEKDFYDFVSKFAPLEGDKSTAIELAYPPLFTYDSTGRFAGTAAVEFQNSNDAHKAIRELDGTFFGGRALWVAMSRNQGQDRNATTTNAPAPEEGDYYNTGSGDLGASQAPSVEKDGTFNETEARDHEAAHSAFNREENHETEYAYYEDEYNPSQDGKGESQVGELSSEDKLLYGHVEKDGDVKENATGEAKVSEKKEDSNVGESEQVEHVSETTAEEK